MAHTIEVFTAGCPLCQRALDAVEVGKCATCVLVERNLTVPDPETARKVEEFGIRAAPTIVIDGRIKVEGVPDFPWFCGDEFYAMLEKRFPLRRHTSAT